MDYVNHSTVAIISNCLGTRLAMLADSQESDEAYDSVTKEYFFDRHAGAFENILHYYRSSELHMDQSMCGNIMRGVSVHSFLSHFCYQEFTIRPIALIMWSDA